MVWYCSCAAAAGRLYRTCNVTLHFNSIVVKGWPYPSSGSRKDRGFGLPGCGRGVIVPEADRTQKLIGNTNGIDTCSAAKYASIVAHQLQQTQNPVLKDP